MVKLFFLPNDDYAGMYGASWFGFWLLYLIGAGLVLVGAIIGDTCSIIDGFIIYVVGALICLLLLRS